MSLSRNAQLVKFFAQQYRGVPRMRLVKLIYMADVLAREYVGHPVSTFSYYRYKYGPYDDAIEEAVRELVAAGLAEEKKERWGQASYCKRVIDFRRPIPFDFDLAESAALDYVATNYCRMNWEEFLRDVVYETAPMKAVNRKGQKLPMTMLDDVGTKRVGFRLAEVLLAEQQGRSGDYVTLGAFVNELRAKAPA